MAFLERLANDANKRYPKSAQQQNGPRPPGAFSLGTGWFGGPMFSDNYRNRRAPNPIQLIEKYKSIIYAMASRNEKAVCRTPLRLYADGSRVQGGKPTRHCDPIKTTRSVARHLCARGMVSPSAVDQVYEVRSHGAIDLIDKPDPYGYFNRTALLSLICRYNDIVGGCWFAPEGPGWGRNAVKSGMKGPPEYLWILYAQYVLPIREGLSPLVTDWQYFSDRIPFDDTIWFRQNISLRDPYGSGYSPAYASDMYSDLEDKFVTLQDQILGMGPMPRVVATAKDPMMPPGRDEAIAFKQQMKSTQSGANAGGIYVNTGAWDFTPMTYAPTDLGGMQLSEYDLHRMASIFDQPPTYYTVDTNLANLQAADEQHAKMGVEPRCVRIAGTLTDMVKRFDPRLFFAFDNCLREDEEMRQKVIDMQIANGQITINQANEESQWPPAEYGNEPWFSSSLAQPSMMMAKHKLSLDQQQTAIDSQKTQTAYEYSSDDSVGQEPDESDTKAAERAMLERVGGIVRDIETELEVIRKGGGKGNPNHVPSWPHGGEFASGGGSGGAVHAKAKRKPKKKKTPRKSVTATGGGKAVDTRVRKRPKTDAPKTKDTAKGERAKASYEAAKSNVHVQRYGEGQEVDTISHLGGVQGSNNGSIDIVRRVGGFEHGLEHKTLVNKGGPNKSGLKAQIKMEKAQLESKTAWVNMKENRRSGVIVRDHRDRAVDADGKFIGNKEAYSGHELYYRRDFGAHTLGGMYQAKSWAEVKMLMSKDDHELRDMLAADPKRWKGVIGKAK